jgi:expansin (peptidoglycan-binding protein)
MRSCLVALATASLPACGSCGSKKPAPADAVVACPGTPLAATGMATYYNATGAGNCSFDPPAALASEDLLVAALNGPDYDHAAWCGACLAVTGPAGEVVVRVVDQCPGCKHGDLDLSRDAFAKIAPLSTGRVAIRWHEVPCPVIGPIEYHLKTRSNAFWVAFQVRNHRYAIERLEARDASGAYQPLRRADYNYFVAARGLGDGPFALRVTDVHGHVIDDPAIALGAGVTRPGAGQFAICP